MGAVILEIHQLTNTSDVLNPERIYDSVIGTCVVSDKRSAMITVPNVSNQERFIHAALKTTGIDPNEIDFIEAYGIGIFLGGIIEVYALSSVFRNLRENINIYYRDKF